MGLLGVLYECGLFFYPGKKRILYRNFLGNFRSFLVIGKCDEFGNVSIKHNIFLFFNVNFWNSLSNNFSFCEKLF
jgi:hypothetical protein